VFDHLEFSVANIDAARRFYQPVCIAIGGSEIFFDDEAKSVGFGFDDIVQLLLTEGKPTAPKFHICFKAQSKDSVETAYAGALAAGGACNGKPGYRDHFGEGYFAAFVFDHDGHNVEILYRELDKITASRS
jgi:predicted lactoylglutathione lyase